MNRAHRIASAIALVALAASVTAGMALAHHGGIEGLFNARGTLDPVTLHDRDSKLKIKVKEPVDVAIVGAQIHAHGQTDWHTHPTDSIVSVHPDAPTLTMVTQDGGRCVEQSFEGGEAFVHPAGPHNFVNDSELPLNFGVAYVVPVGAQLLTAAPRPVGCR